MPDDQPPPRPEDDDASRRDPEAPASQPEPAPEPDATDAPSGEPTADGPAFEAPAPLGATPPPLEGAPRPPAGRPPAGEAPRGRHPRRRFRQFNFGQVLGDTFTVFFRNLPAILVLSLIISGPVVVLKVMTNPANEATEFASWDPETETFEEYQARVDESDPTMSFVAHGGAVLLDLFAQFILTGAIAYLVVRAQQKRPVGMGEALGRGFSRFPALLGTSFLIYIAFGLMFVPAILAGVVAESMGLAIVLFLAALIPLMIWGLSVYVALPACAVEGLGPIESIRRSRQLSIGYRWYILGLVIVMSLIAGMASGVLVFPLALAAKDLMLVQWLTEIVAALIGTPLGAVMVSLVYLELRAVTEGVDADGIADVFA